MENESQYVGCVQNHMSDAVLLYLVLTLNAASWSSTFFVNVKHPFVY